MTAVPESVEAVVDALTEAGFTPGAVRPATDDEGSPSVDVHMPKKDAQAIEKAQAVAAEHGFQVVVSIGTLSA